MKLQNKLMFKAQFFKACFVLKNRAINFMVGGIRGFYRIKAKKVGQDLVCYRKK